MYQDIFADNEPILVLIIKKKESLYEGSPWYKVSAEWPSGSKQFLAFRHGVQPSFEKCAKLVMRDTRWGDSLEKINADDRLLRCVAMGAELKDKSLYSLYKYRKGVRVLRQWVNEHQSRFFSGNRSTDTALNLAKECAELGRVLKNSRCIHGNIRDEAVLVIEHPTDTGFEAKLLLGDFSQAQEANEDGRALVPLPGFGPPTVWQAKEQREEWRAHAISRWDYKLFTECVTVEGAAGEDEMPAVSVWSFDTNTFQLAAMQHYAFSGRSHLVGGKVLVSLPDPFLNEMLRGCLCARRSDRLMPNQVRKHIAIWSKKSCKVFNLLKNMHALLEEGNSSEQQQKFCEQLNKRAAPLLKNARFKGLPEFKGLLALLAQACAVAYPRLAVWQIRRMVCAIRRCLEVHCPGLRDTHPKNKVKDGVDSWDYTCPKLSVRELANLVVHWGHRKEASKAKYLERNGVVKDTELPKFIKFLLGGLAEFLAAVYTALCYSQLKGEHWRELVGLQATDDVPEDASSVWDMVTAAAFTAESREQLVTCDASEILPHSSSSNSGSSGGNNRVEIVHDASGSLSGGAVTTHAAAAAAAEDTAASDSSDDDGDAARIFYIGHGGFVLERMSAWNHRWRIARYFVRNSLELLYHSYLGAITGRYHPAYKVERVYSCSEDVVLSKLAGAKAIKILLGAITLHLVHIRCQQLAGGSSSGGRTHGDQRVLVLVKYLQRSYPKFHCPGELEEDYLLQLMLHRVMLHMCISQPSLSLQERSKLALEEVQLFMNQAKYQPLQEEHHAQVTFLKTLLQHLQANELQPAVKLLAGCPHPLIHLWVHIWPETPADIRVEAAKQLKAQLNGASVPRVYMATELGYIYTGDPLMLQLGTLKVHMTAQNKLQVYGDYGTDQLLEAKEAAENLLNHLDNSPSHPKTKRRHVVDQSVVHFLPSPDAGAAPDAQGGEDVVAAVQPVQLMY